MEVLKASLKDFFSSSFLFLQDVGILSKCIDKNRDEQIN